MSLLTVSNLTVRRGGRDVLKGVDLSIEPGEIVTIVGPNGSGKSTLLRCIIGAIHPDEGQVTKAKGLRIGYVPQKLHVDPSLPLSVARFLSLPNRISSAQTRAVLEQAGAGGLGDHPLSGLSGGQLQRVLLARALVAKPNLLVLDEATQGLDQQGAAAFYQRIDNVRRELGCAIMMVSHDLHVVMAASDRVICLNGHVCCHGTPELVLSTPEYRALFGTGTKGALALYRHEHDHSHDGATCSHEHGHEHENTHEHGHADTDNAPNQPKGATHDVS